MALLEILGAVFLVSAISFVGALTIALRAKTLEKLISFFLALAAGVLVGAAFFNLLPEAVEKVGAATAFGWASVGIVAFFALEGLIHWHYHRRQRGKKGIKSIAYVVLFGDGVHNLIDGAAIAATFLTSFPLGVVTTVAVILHEIPQEIGDFGALIYSGMRRRKALLFNFASALTAVAGALLVFFVPEILRSIEILIGFVAGAFIYLALFALLPELHRTKGKKAVLVSFAEFLVFLLGLGIVYGLTKAFGAA